MTAPLAHPVPHPEALADEAVSDARLFRALKTLAAIIRKHGPGPMPIFERLEAEHERREERAARLDKYLEG